MAPLSAEQKKRLCMLAREAWAEQRRRGAAPDPAMDGRSEAQGFAVWRRLQQAAACGQTSLRCCANTDYLPIRARFLDLAGRPREAREAAAKHATEPRQWALACLRKACHEARDVLPRAWDYADGFLRKRRGAGIGEADAKALWHAVFLLRRRAAQLRRGKAVRA